MLKSIDRSLSGAHQQTAKHYLAKEFDHVKLLKLREKRMLEDLDREKYHISYRTHLTREDLRMEPHPNSLPRLIPPVAYNTMVS